MVKTKVMVKMVRGPIWPNLVPMPAAVEALADRPSLLPRRLIATLRALGIGAVGAVATGGAALAWGQLERRWPTVRRYQVAALRPDLASQGSAMSEPQISQGMQHAASDEVRQEAGVSSSAQCEWAKVRPVTFLHISDLHLFPGQEFLVDFLNRVARTEHFDAVISTGDNFGSSDGLDLVRAAYEPFLGYPGAFVLGSNDYYAPARKPWASYVVDRFAVEPPSRVGLPWWEMVQMFVDAGWVDLTNQAATMTVSFPDGFKQPVSLLGVDDPHIERDRMPAVGQDWSDATHLRVALTHAPYKRVLDSFTQVGADLVLAGHTHGGQIALPGVGALLTNSDLPRRYARGLHTWHTSAGKTPFEVCAGLGTSPFARVRIAARPEVALVQLVPTV